MLAPDVLYLRGLDFFSEVVERVSPSDWEHPSPCEGWRAVDLVGHVGAAVRFGTALLRGQSPAWRPAAVPGEAVDGDPARWWADIAEAARGSVTEVDLEREVDSPMGPRKVAEGLTFPAVDLFVHGWDLARSVGTDVVISDDVIEFARERLGAMPPDALRGTGVFRAEVPVGGNASITEAFIAWTGRDPKWASD